MITGRGRVGSIALPFGRRPMILGRCQPITDPPTPGIGNHPLTGAQAAGGPSNQRNRTLLRCTVARGYASTMATPRAPRFRGLVFDFFGVLTFNMVEVISAFEDREKIRRGTFLRAWADPRGQDLFRSLELGEIAQTDWNTGFAALMGVAPDDLMARYLHDAFPAYLVLGVAKQARAVGIRTGVVSNSLGRQPYDPYAGFDLHDTFDAVVLSAEHGVRKPDPLIFQLVLDRLGLAAEECLFVDDSEENLVAAQRLGMGALHALDERIASVQLRAMLGLPDL
jgi:putative hydrolase of the HAD superfamily